MTAPLDPIELRVPGILSLRALAQPYTDGRVDVSGQLHFALSRSVESALGFLPALVRRQLSSNLVHSELERQRFRFRVGQLVTVETWVTEQGVMTLEARYHSLLARPVGQGETARVFEGFDRALKRSGLDPHSSVPIQGFLQGFRRRDRGELAFLELFEGRAITGEGGQTPVLRDLQLNTVELRQDARGDLEVHYRASGRSA
ncbi:MAG: hypothetical protein ACO1RX_08320 [Candidatus Sericytochromatia bacterium]